MLKVNYRLVLFFICAVAFVLVVKNNSKTSAEAMEDISEDVYDENLVKTSRYEIYTGDYSTYKGKIAKLLEIDQSLDTLDIVRKVASSLTEALYNDLPIEVTIEDRNSKKVAIINLIEPLSSNNKEFRKLYDELEDKSNTWQYNFSSGEAKSIITLASLNETFSQINCTGKWVDGYMIYHNGETLDDHRKLTTTDITWLKK